MKHYTELKLEDYQQYFLNKIKTNERFGVFLRVGAGKTLIMLEAIRYFLSKRIVRRVLVLCPKHVIYDAWIAEIHRWRYPISFHVAHGRGLRVFDLSCKVHFATNDVVSSKFYPNYIKRLAPDILVVDESSKYRNHDSKRTKNLIKTCLRTIKRGNMVIAHQHVIKRIYLLSATPAPNSIENLYTQALLLDGGKALGVTITRFRDTFLIKKPHSFNQYIPHKGAIQAIYRRIKPFAESVKVGNFLPIKYEDMAFLEKESFYKHFFDLKKHCLLELQNVPENKQLFEIGKNAKFTKLRQLASGVVYIKNDWTGVNETHEFSTLKVKRLVELVDSLEGRPLLVAYNFNSEKEMILRYLPKKIKTAVICGGMKRDDVSKIIDLWNKKELTVLLGHPASMGHGLNLQKGGSDIVWFSPTLNLELYKQLNGRLDRKGQEERVIVRHMIIKDTLDQHIYDNLNNKSQLLKSLLDFLAKKHHNKYDFLKPF